MHDQYYKAFSSFPAIQLNDRMGNVYEPYARIFPLKDVFTYISFADIGGVEPEDEYALIETVEIALYDTLKIKNNLLTLKGLKSPNAGGAIDTDNISIEALLEINTHFGMQYNATPSFLVRDGRIGHVDHSIEDLDLKFRFLEVTEKPFTIVLQVYEHRPDFIIIKTVIFPYINLLWISCIVILVGMGMAMKSRWRKKEINDI
jgi:cytochrome c-type biogenesis protein CcmF